MEQKNPLQEVAGRKNFGGSHPVITPLPALMIATYDEHGHPDVMMAAWGGQCDYNQIQFELSAHKTTDNLRLKRAFTVSFAGKDNVAESDYLGMVSGHKVPDKVARVGFTWSPSPNVDAPIIDQYPLTLECRVVLLENNEDGGARVVGEVVNMSAAESILNNEGKIDLGKLQPIIYDSSLHVYRVVGESVGKAWGSGKAFKE
ncbi:MAG: flavin reductase [Bacteroidaceae bacterium]|nr:flavin reductase [Bacteroidaceae bacterium]